MSTAMTQARTYPAGVTSWIDVEADDVADAQRFYGALVRLDLQARRPRRASPSSTSSRQLGRTGRRRHRQVPQQPPATRRRGWHTYVAVDDIEATIAVGRSQRAGRLATPSSRPARAAGTRPSLTRPASTFRLWQAKRRARRPDHQHARGRGTSATCTRPTRRRRSAFYEQVFGWVFADMGFATMIQVPGLRRPPGRDRRPRPSTSGRPASTSHPASPTRSGGSTLRRPT